MRANGGMKERLRPVLAGFEGKGQGAEDCGGFGGEREDVRKGLTQDRRGRGLLKVASSHWEVIGWGERDGEKWAVTWFAPSMFTPAGVDIYSGNKKGMSEA